MADPKEKPSAPPREAGKPEAASTAPAGAERTEEWIFTVDSESGDVTKVEKSETGGERRELTEDEYAAIADQGSEYDDYSTADEYGAYGYDPYSTYAAQSYDPYGYEEGYYQALADYEASLAGAYGGEGYEGAEYAEESYGSGYTPQEEAAYYQGMADYASFSGY